MSEKDSKDDPLTPLSSSTRPKTPTSVGSIRWAGGSQSTTPSGSFSMDVTAFEKKLQEKREQKLHEQSPRIDIHLKSVPASTSAASSPAESQIKVNIRHNIEHGHDDSVGHDEVDHAIPIQSNRITTHRVVTYERVFKQKSIREISVVKKRSPTNETDQTPKVQRTEEYTIEKSLSSEQIGNADDSAYHSHRVRIASTGTPTTVSVSSSNASLPHDFTSDENIYTRRTPSRERILSMERAGSEPKQFPSSFGGTINSSNSNSSTNVSMNVVYAGDGATSPQEWNLVSSVTGSNENVRRHLAREHYKSSSECASPDWYSEYQAQSFHTSDRPHRMDYKRSNSQYDNHIRQIRGIQSSHFILS